MGLKGGGSKSWVGVVKGVVVSFSKGSSKFGFFGPGGGSKKKTYAIIPPPATLGNGNLAINPPAT